MRVVVLSDVHFGNEDRAAITTATRFVHAYGPDAVFMAGDLSMYGRKRELEAAADWLQALGAPVLCTPGNHDTPFWDIVARARAPFARYAGFVGSFAAEALVGPGFAAHAVTTARGMQLRANWALGSIDLREVQAAVARLLDAAPMGVRLIVAHHPFLTPHAAPLPGRTRRGELAMRLCADAGVDVVVSGHLHMPFLEAAPQGDGLTYAAGCGTLSERVRGAPPSVLTLEWDGGPLQATCIDCSGPESSARWTERRPLRARPRSAAG